MVRYWLLAEWLDSIYEQKSALSYIPIQGFSTSLLITWETTVKRMDPVQRHGLALIDTALEMCMEIYRQIKGAIPSPPHPLHIHMHYQMAELGSKECS